MPKVVGGYEEENYNQKESLYDSLVQAFEDTKSDCNAKLGGWNLLSEKINGITMKLVGDSHISLTFHHYEITTVEGLAVMESEGPKFLKEFEKEMKKKFKKLTGKTLKLSKIKEDQSIEKVSRVQADTSWMIGSSRYGYGGNPKGNYLVKDSIIYSVDANL